MNNRIHEFDLTPYPRKLWVTCACSTAALNDLFSDGVDGKPFDEMDECDSATVYSVRRKKPDVRGGILIRFRSKKDMKQEEITHESCHAALEVYNYICQDVKFDSQEPFCYLAGYIADCCEQVRTNKFKK